MLVTVEGPSAVGKTALLLSATPTESVVGEGWEAVGVSRAAEPAAPLSSEAQRFWVDLNVRRWEQFLEVEERRGTAYADTDPLKLYYNFALVKAGELPREVFEEGWRLSREAMEGRRLGFVDRVVYLKASPATLAKRKASDAARTRRNFGLHQRLTKAMEGYYAALEELRPETVCWLDAEGEIPKHAAIEALSGEAPRRDRYDVALLDALKAELDRLLEGGSPPSQRPASEDASSEQLGG